MDIIARTFTDHVETLRRTREQLADKLGLAAQMIIDCLRRDGAVLIFGNGGSAADSQHIAGELVGHFLVDRPPMRAEALSTDTSCITCIANDYAYDQIFSRQVLGKGRMGDVAIGLSTSGNSANVVAGLAAARKLGMKTIAFTGEGGGKCAPLADILLDVPSTATPRIQEAHQVMYHIICDLVEKAMVG